MGPISPSLRNRNPILLKSNYRQELEVPASLVGHTAVLVPTHSWMDREVCPIGAGPRE